MFISPEYKDTIDESLGRESLHPLNSELPCGHDKDGGARG